MAQVSSQEDLEILQAVGQEISKNGQQTMVIRRA